MNSGRMCVASFIALHTLSRLTGLANRRCFEQYCAWNGSPAQPRGTHASPVVLAFECRGDVGDAISQSPRLFF
jgi:hypothetical protein